MRPPKDYKHFKFIQVSSPPQVKTRRWEARTKDERTVLGNVRWYAHWRRYVFFPEANTLYDQNCLWDIADFVAERTAEQKEIQKENRRGLQTGNK